MRGDRRRASLQFSLLVTGYQPRQASAIFRSAEKVSAFVSPPLLHPAQVYRLLLLLLLHRPPLLPFIRDARKS